MGEQWVPLAPSFCKVLQYLAASGGAEISTRVAEFPKFFMSIEELCGYILVWEFPTAGYKNWGTSERSGNLLPGFKGHRTQGWRGPWM